MTPKAKEEYRAAYLDTQFERYAPLPLYSDNYPHGINIQMRTKAGVTNWLNVTAETARALESLIRCRAELVIDDQPGETND